MKLKLYASLIIVGLLIEAALIICDVNPVVAMSVAFLVAMGGYFIWWGRLNKRLNNILDEKCDPIKFIEENEKAKAMSKRTAFQNFCNLNIAVGLGSLGRNEEALEILLNTVDVTAKNSKAFDAVYHQALFCFYINTGDLESAAFEYDNYLMEYRKSIKHFAFTFAVDAAVAEYQYKRSKTTETAKIFLKRLEYLSSTYSKKLSKRGRLNILYNKADILAELGEHESALEKYKIVAENGGSLWIAVDSREKLAKKEKPE